MKADRVSTGGTHTHARTQQMTVHHSDLNTTKYALNDNLNLYTGQRKTHLKPFKMMFYVILVKHLVHLGLNQSSGAR